MGKKDMIQIENTIYRCETMISIIQEYKNNNKNISKSDLKNWYNELLKLKRYVDKVDKLVDKSSEK